MYAMSEIFNYIAFMFLTFPYTNVNCIQPQFRYKNGYENREELVIRNVTSYDHFEVGRGVTEWESVTIDGKNYAVGLMNTGICIFTAEMDANGDVIVKNTTDLKNKFFDIELVKYWNKTSKTNEPILLLVTNTFKLLWCKISNNLELEKIWEWNLRKMVVHINVFKIADMYHLLILKKQSYYTADLYRFQLDQEHGKHFWLSQDLQLKYVVRSSTFSAYGSNYFLSIPQNDMVCVFKYENGRFSSFTNISSPGVNSVRSFNLGLKSYLVMDGQNVGIYKFNTYGVAKEDVENMSFDGINFWLPIKLVTYKDEIILLGQRILDHGNHTSKRIEVILSSGDKFYLHEEIPCRYYGELLNGIDCLVEEENHNSSISGSAPLFFGETLGMVIPRRSAPSGMIFIHVYTRPIPNPMERRIAELKSLRNKLEKMVVERRETVREIRQRSKDIDTMDQNGIKPKSSESEKTSKASAAYSDTKANFSSPRSRQGDTLNDLKSKVQTIKNYVKDVKERLKTAVRKDAKEIYLKDLVIDGPVAIKGKSKIKNLKTTTLNDIKADDLFINFVRLGDDKAITGAKTFKKLNVERIDVETINDRNVSNMAFRKDSKALNLKGVLVIGELAEVTGDVLTTSGKINDNIDLSQALKVDDHYEDEVVFGEVETNTLQTKSLNKLPIHNNHIGNVNFNTGNLTDKVLNISYMPGNLTVREINGENLQDILDSICMRNKKSVVLGKTVVDGNINITNNAETDHLNHVKFPEDYVFKGNYSRGYQMKLPGNKHFENELMAKTMLAKDINGINTQTLVTLADNQTIKGPFTFINLNVFGDFDIEGNITGVSDVSPSPTVKEAKVLDVDMNFSILEIEGMLTIGNSINGNNLEQMLDDVVYKDEETVIITSLKDFPNGLTVKNDTKIDSNRINEIPLHSFVHKVSEQPLQINVLNGNVTFLDLYLTGLFGGVNINKLNNETVKLTKNQFISSTLNFIEDVEVKGEFGIKEVLNDVAPNSYIYKNDNRSLPSVNSLDDVEVDTLLVKGNFNGKFENFDVDKFDKERMSLSKNQTVRAKYVVENLHVGTLNATKINNYNYADLTDPSRYHTLVLNRILDNKIIVKSLKITGNLTVKSISGVKMDDILKVCMYQSENQLTASNITFNDVAFNTVTIEKFNDIPFEAYVANLVYKNETTVVFEKPVLFWEGFEVSRYIDTSSINGKPVESILRKAGNQKIVGPIVIEGNISIESDTTVGENINKIPVRYLKEAFEVVDQNTYRINDEVTFDNVVSIEDLYVNGFVNGKNWSKFLDEIIRRNDDAIVPRVTHFLNEVQINGNLGVMEGINDRDLSKFSDDIVYTTYDTYIQGLVSFAQPVQVKETLIVEDDLLCETVMGIDIRNWWKNAVFINEGLIEGILHFESVTIKDSVSTLFLNSINMSTVIPLRTNQYIPESLYIETISANRNITVDNLVNDVKLEPEFFNTVLNEGHQKITSEIEFFDNVVVHEDFTTSGLVNGLDLNKVVTLNTDQNLTATYNFDQKVVMHSNLIVDGLVNNINISNWRNKALRKDSEFVQNMEGPLVIRQNLTVENDLTGNDAICDLEFDVVESKIKERKLFKANEENQIMEGYNKICDNVNYLLHQTKSQIYRFRYFDQLQSMHFTNDVKVIVNFQHEDVYYMLVNEINSCKSHLFTWSGVSGYSLIRDDIQTGEISQFITVRDRHNSLFLIGRGDVQNTSCSIEGTNVWEFENVEEFLHIHKLKNLALLQESKIPGTFYGFTKEYAYEFNIGTHQVSTVRKWRIEGDDNLAYMPYNLGTGLALRNGKKIFKLPKEETTSNDLDDFDHNLEEIAVEAVAEELNYFVPGRFDGDFITLDVGKPIVRTLTAITQHEDTTIRGKFDFVTIYDNIFKNKIFHKIPTYKPGSLMSMEFGRNGETLLIFLEDEKVIQIFEYKGIEGFKHRSTIEQEGQKLMQISLPLPPSNKPRKVLAVINHNELKLMQVVMDGFSMEEEYLQCSLRDL